MLRLFPQAPVTQMAVHFVNFKDDRYWAAVKVFGKPDFIHRRWDRRAQEDFAPGDIYVFAEGQENDPITDYSFNDSNFL